MLRKSKFTFLLKSEPTKKPTSQWVLDESKCLSMREVLKPRRYANRLRHQGFKNKQFSRIREWFMVELGLQAGLRVTEMASLQHGHLYIDHTRSSLVFTGKGNKKRLVWVSATFRQLCRIYLSYKKKFGYDLSNTSYLLNNLKGTQITKRALQKNFTSMIEKAKLSSHFSIHCLRHTYATFLLKASNYNYRFVQRQLGHASMRTTQTYAGILESEGKKALEKLYK